MMLWMAWILDDKCGVHGREETETSCSIRVCVVGVRDSMMGFESMSSSILLWNKSEGT